VPQASN
jgi:hypothetical protein